MEFFMSGQVGEFNLSVLTRLVSSELVQGMACLEGPLVGWPWYKSNRGVDLCRD